MKFPGDECDPFIDWCLDGYECQQSGNDQGEINYTCQEFIDTQGDGTLGSPCNYYPLNQCATGFRCAGGEAPFCPGGACCVKLCVYQEICDNGAECQAIVWQSSLADYLDIYTGIGMCVEQ